MIGLIDNARKYAEKVNSKLMDSWYDDRYKYYSYNWHSQEEMPNDDWNKMCFVSVDKNDNILGYISYSLDRAVNSAHSLGAINFSDNKIAFGKDLC